MRTFVMGDIHGGYLALKQCLERSGFDKEKDTLIQLGDICDGWDEVYESIEELLTIKNLIQIKGNHDDWFIEWMTLGTHPTHWLHGAYATAESYKMNSEREIILRPSMGGWVTNLTTFDIPETHREFFKKMIPYYVDEQNRLFVHGGFNRHFDITDPIHNAEHILIWDRDMFNSALSYEAMSVYGDDAPVFKIKNNFKEIFIGHTSTTNWNTDKPMKACNVWNLDTGAGFKGKLTIMNVENKEYFQSDILKNIYINQRGRN